MLILSRKTDESIVINENIEVRITRIEGDVVKIGINAPREVAVYRKELLESIGESNREAALKSHPPRLNLPKNKVPQAASRSARSKQAPKQGGRQGTAR